MLTEQIINFENISFHDFDFIEKKYIKKQDFQYGAVSGIAEMIGFQIILFKREENQQNLVLDIDWGENENPQVLDVANKILGRLNFKLVLCDKLDEIKSLYGDADYTDKTSENSATYYYLNSDKSIMYSFGVSESLGLTRCEFICDVEIVNDRICLLEKS